LIVLGIDGYNIVEAKESWNWLVQILCRWEHFTYEKTLGSLNISLMQEEYYDVFKMYDARCMMWCYSDVDMIGTNMHNGIEIYPDGWDAWYDDTMMQTWLMLKWCEYDRCMMYEKCQDMPEWSRWDAQFECWCDANMVDARVIRRWLI